MSAMDLYEQARALAAPSDEYLKDKNVSRKTMSDTFRTLSMVPGDKFNFKELVPDSTLWGALGGIGGGALGGAIGKGTGSWGNAALGGLGGLAIGGLGGYLAAEQKRQDMLNVAKILKDYGLLNPNVLRRALPVLT